MPKLDYLFLIHPVHLFLNTPHHRNFDSINQNKAGFPLGEFIRANKQKANVIGW